MDCTPKEKHRLVKLAIQLATSLENFRTPRSNEPVDHNHVSFILTYVRTKPSAKNLLDFLDLAPNSEYAKRSRSFPPQLKEAARRTKEHIRLIDRDFAQCSADARMEFLSFVLAEAKRILYYKKSLRNEKKQHHRR